MIKLVRDDWVGKLQSSAPWRKPGSPGTAPARHPVCGGATWVTLGGAVQLRELPLGGPPGNRPTGTLAVAEILAEEGRSAGCCAIDGRGQR